MARNRKAVTAEIVQRKSAATAGGILQKLEAQRIARARRTVRRQWRQCRVLRAELALREQLLWERELAVEKREREALEKEQEALKILEEAVKQREEAIEDLAGWDVKSGAAPSPGPSQPPKLPHQLPLPATGPTPDIPSVPDEVLEKIFRYLSPDDIISHVLPVCHRWWDVAMNQVLAKLSSLHFDNGRSLQFLQETRISLPAVRKLQVECDSFYANEMEVLLVCCPQVNNFLCKFCTDEMLIALVQGWGSTLQVLKLCGYDLFGYTLGSLASCSQLRELEIEYLIADGAALQDLTALSQLEVLNLKSAYFLHAPYLEQFLYHSQSAGRLRKLDFSGCDSVGDSVLIAVAARCPSLEELSMLHTAFSWEGVREVLRSCRRLRSLTLKVTFDMCQILALIPQLAPQLRKLQFGIYPLGDFAEDAFKHLRAEMPDLTIINDEI